MPEPCCPTPDDTVVASVDEERSEEAGLDLPRDDDGEFCALVDVPGSWLDEAEDFGVEDEGAPAVLAVCALDEAAVAEGLEAEADELELAWLTCDAVPAALASCALDEGEAVSAVPAALAFGALDEVEAALALCWLDEAAVVPAALALCAFDEAAAALSALSAGEPWATSSAPWGCWADSSGDC